MKAIKYTLEANAKQAGVFLHTDTGLKSGIETVQSKNGKGVKPTTLDGLRKHGIKMAKRNNVPFEDLS